MGTDGLSEPGRQASNLQAGSSSLPQHGEIVGAEDPHIVEGSPRPSWPMREHALPLSCSASCPTSRRPSGGVRELRDLPLDIREQIADVLGCEAAAHGLDEHEVPNSYGEELGAPFDALGLQARTSRAPRRRDALPPLELFVEGLSLEPVH
jgi:hypothetical protein